MNSSFILNHSILDPLQLKREDEEKSDATETVNITKSKKIARLALLNMSSMELAGPPSEIDLQWNEEFRKHQTDIIKHETRGKSFKGIAASINERLVYPSEHCLVPFAEGMDFEGAGSDIRKSLVAAKLLAFPIKVATAPLTPLIDTLIAGVSETLELTPWKEDMRSAAKWVANLLPTTTLPQTLKEKYDIPINQTEEGLQDTMEILLATVPTAAFKGGAKLISKFKGTSAATFSVEEGVTLTPSLAMQSQTNNHLFTVRSQLSGLQAIEHDFSPIFSRGLFTDEFLSEGIGGAKALELSSEILQVAKIIQETGNPHLHQLQQLLRKCERVIPEGGINHPPSQHRILGLIDQIFSQDITGFECARARLGSRIFQKLDGEGPVKWLSDQEIANQVLEQGVKPNAYSRARFFHGTDLQGLQGILKSEGINVTKRHASTRRGAWVAEDLNLASTYGDYILVFNRSIVWLHQRVSGKHIENTFGFEGKIPVTVHTLEGVVELKSVQSLYERSIAIWGGHQPILESGTSLCEREVALWAGRPVSILDVKKLHESSVKQKLLIGKPFPSSWKRDIQTTVDQEKMKLFDPKDNVNRDLFFNEKNEPK